jgi:hypothetical protein
VGYLLKELPIVDGNDARLLWVYSQGH